LLADKESSENRLVTLKVEFEDSKKKLSRYEGKITLSFFPVWNHYRKNLIFNICLGQVVSLERELAHSKSMSASLREQVSREKPKAADSGSKTSADPEVDLKKIFSEIDELKAELQDAKATKHFTEVLLVLS
jgi:hypothetical protein